MVGFSLESVPLVDSSRGKSEKMGKLVINNPNRMQLSMDGNLAYEIIE